MLLVLLAICLIGTDVCMHILSLIFLLTLKITYAVEQWLQKMTMTMTMTAIKAPGADASCGTLPGDDSCGVNILNAITNAALVACHFIFKHSTLKAAKDQHLSVLPVNMKLT